MTMLFIAILIELASLVTWSDDSHPWNKSMGRVASMPLWLAICSNMCLCIKSCTIAGKLKVLVWFGLPFRCTR